MPNYTDKDITFFMGIYRDYPCAEIALAQIKEHFPEARVILRSDGDPSLQNRELAERHDVEYYEEERLYPVENGAALLIRTFELFLDRPTRYLFKVDTDTAVHRRFQFLP